MRIEGRLTPDGPLVGFWMRTNKDHQKEYAKNDLLVPKTYFCGVIDTGCNVTIVDHKLMTPGCFRPANGEPVFTINSTDQWRRKFNVEIQVGNHLGESTPWMSWTVIESNILRPGMKQSALLGRDFLDGKVLTYDGKNQTFTLEW